MTLSAAEIKAIARELALELRRQEAATLDAEYLATLDPAAVKQLMRQRMKEEGR